MNVDKATFKAFQAEVEDQFPYDEVRSTRNGYYPKWILMEAEHPGVLFRPSGTFCLLTKTLPNGIIQSIIVSRSGLPMPPDFCEVMDCMEWWGRGLYPNWEQAVLRLFKDCLNPNGWFDGKGPSRKELFQQVCLLLVELKAADHVSGLMGLGPNEILFDYAEAFEDHYKETHDFFELAKRANAWCKNAIDNWMEHGMNQGLDVPDHLYVG